MYNYVLYDSCRYVTPHNTSFSCTPVLQLYYGTDCK